MKKTDSQKLAEWVLEAVRAARGSVGEPAPDGTTMRKVGYGDAELEQIEPIARRVLEEEGQEKLVDRVVAEVLKRLRDEKH